MSPKDSDFEGLEIYQRSRALRKRFYALARKLPEEEKFLLRLQILDAARSLTNNIAEGRGRFYYQSQIRFMRDALGSLNELIDDLNICLDEKYFDEVPLNGLKEECYELRAKLKAYVSYLRQGKKGKEH